MKTITTLAILIASTTVNAQLAFDGYNKLKDGAKSGYRLLVSDTTITLKDQNIERHKGNYKIEGDKLTLFFDTVNPQYCNAANRFAEYVITRNESELHITSSNLDNQCEQLDSLVMGVWVAQGVQVSVTTVSNNSEVNVYPNPATTQITLEGKKSKITFTSIATGQVTELETNETHDISEWPRGFYHVECFGLIVLE